jgi:Tfp pilus assembly protein PilF
MPYAKPTTRLIPTQKPSRRPACPILLAALLFANTLHAQDFSHSNTEPAPQNALIQKANDALAVGDFSAALTILNKLNAEAPNNPQVLYDLGMTLEALEPASNAPPGTTPASPAPPDQKALSPESCYRKAIEANPAFPPAHVALGLLLARTNRPAEAHAQLAAAVALQDIEPTLKAHALRALSKLDQQATPPNLADASDELLQALKLTPEQPADILLSAEIAEASPDLRAAEKAYRRYLATPDGADDSQSTAALAHILLAEQRPADAEALLSPALARHPSNPSFTAQLVEAYLDSGDQAKAAQAAPLLEKLHTDHPDERSITRLLARLYLESDRADLADPLYASLIANSPSSPDPTLLDARAEGLLRLHRPAEAEKLLKQAVTDRSAFPSPDAFADAATHLAFAAAEIDDPRMTLQALSLRAIVQPPSPSSLFLEATANDALHQMSKAADLYRKFLTAANGKLPDQELQARQRLAELQHTK